MSQAVAGRPGRRFSLGWWCAAWVAIAAAGVTIKASLPVQYIFGAAFDDELMVRMARGFLHGRWSVSWADGGVLSLAKPVGFPLLLAAAHGLPWSPLVTEYLVYLVGAGLIGIGWWRVSRSCWQATVLFALVSFNPVLFSKGSQRIYRDGWSAALCSVAIGLAFVLGSVLWRQSRSGVDEVSGGAGGSARSGRLVFRLVARVAGISCMVVAMGVAVGWAAITKPTWYFLAPAVLAPLAVPVVLAVRRSTRPARTAALVGVAAVVAAGSCAGVIAATVAMNRATYGVGVVEDLDSGAVARAWKALASIEAGRPEPYAPVTLATERDAYAASPSARVLEPYLSKLSGPRNAHCPTRRCYPYDHVEWQLQTAAAEAGEGGSAVQMQRFFDRMADEIETACHRGRLHCSSSPVLATGLPPLDDISLSSVASQTVRGLGRMIWGQYTFATASVVPPTPAQYDEWTSVVRGIPSIGTVSHPAGDRVLYAVLRVLDGLYTAFAVVALGLIVLGLGTWLAGIAQGRRRGPPPRGRRPGRWRRLRRGRRRADEGGGWESPAVVAAVASLGFLIAAVVGMALLALFDVGQSPTYLTTMYWSDFSPCITLFLAFGAFAGLAPLSGRLAGVRGRQARGQDAAVVLSES